MLLCLERAKLVVEPAGAAAVAAIMAHPEAFTPPVVAVLSGGNIDPLVLLHVTQHGLVAARRFLTLRVEIVDRPGRLAALLALVAELGGNVVDVVHSRLGSSLQMGDVEVALRMETQGAGHCDQLVAGAGRGRLPDPGTPLTSAAGPHAREACRTGQLVAGRAKKRAGQPTNGLASSTLTFWVRPLGRMYSRDSPREAPRMAWPSGDCGE